MSAVSHQLSAFSKNSFIQYIKPLLSEIIRNQINGDEKKS